MPIIREKCYRHTMPVYFTATSCALIDDSIFLDSVRLFLVRKAARVFVAVAVTRLIDLGTSLYAVSHGLCCWYVLHCQFCVCATYFCDVKQGY